MSTELLINTSTTRAFLPNLNVKLFEHLFLWSVMINLIWFVTILSSCRWDEGIHARNGGRYRGYHIESKGQHDRPGRTFCLGRNLLADGVQYTSQPE